MKHLSRIILFLFMSLGLQAQEKVSIAFLSEENQNIEYLNQLKTSIKDLIGNEYDIEFQEPLNNKGDLSLAKQQYYSLNKHTTQLIIATGIVNCVLFYEELNIKIPTIVVGGINKDLVPIDSKKTTSGKHNVNYIVLPNSYTGDLNDFTSVYDYKKIGVIMNQSKINSLPIKNIFDKYFSKKKSTYKFIPLKDNKIDSSLLTTVDAVYLADGFSLSDNDRTELISLINSKKLASFSVNGLKDVNLGVLVCNKPKSTIDQLFRKISLHVESILKGQNASSLPLFIKYRNQLSLNYSTAKNIGLKIPYSLLARANVLGSEEQLKTKGLSLSLRDIMYEVMDNNLSLSSNRKDILLSKQDIEISKSKYLPDLAANAQGVYIDPELAKISNGQNPELSGKANLELKQLIYSADASAAIKINKKLHEAQKESFNSQELDILLNTAVSYFNALILKTNVFIQNKNLQVTKENLEIANQNFEVGTAGKSDILRFRSQLAQNTQNVIDASNQLRQMYLSINQLRNVELKSEFKLKDADISNGLFKNYNYKNIIKLLDSHSTTDRLIDFLVSESLANSADLKNINLNIDANTLNYQLNKKARFLPTVALQGQYSMSLLKTGKGSDVPPPYPILPDNTYNAAINISLPIFNQKSRRIKQHSALIQGDKLEIQRKNIHQNLEKNVRELVIELTGTIANIQISKVSEQAAKESLDLTQTAYQSGSVPIIQIIDAQSNYFQSQLASSTSKYQFLLASIKLERIMGHFFILQTPEENEVFFQKAKTYITSKK